MTYIFIIIVCVVLLLAYLLELFSSKSKIPSAILLIFLGWLIKQITTYLNIKIAHLSTVLPILGTCSLVLIVLDSALDLEVNKLKLPLIKKTFFGAICSLLVTAIIFTFFFYNFSNLDIKKCLTNAIPFCIISSAVAIPSVKSLSPNFKMFIIYESIFSGIIGIVFFNFLNVNDSINIFSIEYFVIQLILILIVSISSTYFISKIILSINHSIKFVPIMLMVLLIYAISKYFNLSGLIFILLFGVIVENIDKLSYIKWVDKLKPKLIKVEMIKFKVLLIEGTFIIKVMFFVLFGFQIENKELFDTNGFKWSFFIVVIIFLIRFYQIKLLKLSLLPLFFIAPRGLHTILLFFTIKPINRIGFLNNAVIIQILILTAFLMLIGVLLSKQKHI